MHPVDHKQNIVEVENLSFSYANQEVLSNINLTIHRGDYLAVVGGNGSGKTTLIKIILGLLKPGSGDVYHFGTNIKDFKEWRKVGYVSQKATNFDANFPATVEEVVLMGRYARRGLLHHLVQDDRKKAREALEKVEMWQYRGRQIGDLSGGEQQRVFIARALASEPEIIFLDEPTAGIDKDAREDFYTLLKKLNQKFNLTVILVTHDVLDIANEAMHVACINQTLFFHDSVESFLKDTKPVHIHEHA